MSNECGLRQRRGMTLIDVTVAMALTGVVLATAAGSAGESMERWRVNQAANDLAASVRAARVEAIMTRSEVVAPIDIQRRRYVVASRQAPGPTREVVVGSSVRRVADLPPGVEFRAPFSSAGLPRGAGSVTLVPPTFDEPAIMFNSRGQLLSRNIPGYIYVAHLEDGRYARVVVEVSGNVRVEQLRGQSWE